MAKSVLLIGHSFVRRMERQGMDFGLDRTRSEVDFCGYVHGRPLNLIEQLIAFLPTFHVDYRIPDVVIFLLGSNDLASHPSYSPMGLALQLCAIGRWFRRRGVTRIIFTEVLPRFGFGAFRPCPQFLWQAHIGVVTIQDAERLFMRRAIAFNATLKAFCRVSEGCSFLKLQGLHVGVQSLLEDGLHLSVLGRRRLRASLRRAMIVDLHRCEAWTHMISTIFVYIN